MKKEYAEYLLKKTTQDYNLIAEEFSRSRGKLWEELRFLGDYAFAGEKVLDLGCGNGRLYELFKNRPIDYFGVDVSEKMIEIAKNRFPQARFEITHPLKLSFPNNYFDKIFSIATFHHIPSVQFRLQFLREIRRVLKPEGELYLTVWKLNIWKKLPLVLKYTLLKIFRKSKLDFGDILIPWGRVGERYVHYFSKKELKHLMKKAKLKLKEIKIIKRPRGKESNIYLVAGK